MIQKAYLHILDVLEFHVAQIDNFTLCHLISSKSEQRLNDDNILNQRENVLE